MGKDGNWISLVSSYISSTFLELLSLPLLPSFALLRVFRVSTYEADDWHFAGYEQPPVRHGVPEWPVYATFALVECKHFWTFCALVSGKFSAHVPFVFLPKCALTSPLGVGQVSWIDVAPRACSKGAHGLDALVVPVVYQQMGTVLDFESGPHTVATSNPWGMRLARVVQCPTNPLQYTIMLWIKLCIWGIFGSLYICIVYCKKLLNFGS